MTIDLVFRAVDVKEWRSGLVIELLSMYSSSSRGRKSNFYGLTDPELNVF